MSTKEKSQPNVWNGLLEEAIQIHNGIVEINKRYDKPSEGCDVDVLRRKIVMMEMQTESLKRDLQETWTGMIKKQNAEIKRMQGNGVQSMTSCPRPGRRLMNWDEFKVKRGRYKK